MTTSTKQRGKRLSKTRLDRLVEEAIVDCYNESEQVTGLYTMIEGNLALPFETMVLGVQVTVERVDLTQRERRSTGGSSTFSADASFLLLFRRVSGCYGSKMGADNTGSIPQRDLFELT